MFVLTSYQNPTLPDNLYYWTGQLSANDYPPPWSWRKDMALRMPTEEIANQWKDMGIVTNDGATTDIQVKELK